VSPVFFNNKSALRAWFENHHQSETELLVGYYTVKSKKETITWSQSVDEAICFGWIDGIRRSIDQERYCIRFTPRRPGSNWSLVNIKKVEELTKQGLMHPSGLEAFSGRKDVNSGVYSYESNKQALLHESMEKVLRQSKRAWSYFESETPSYRKISIRWVMSAKQEITRLNRLNELIKACEAGKKIKAMSYGKNK
jgi:uncharacterized protein YdeI (YjbR/CyaY-like superfamily)